MLDFFKHQKQALDEVKGYNGKYLITTNGEVYSCNTHKWLKLSVHNGKLPYYYVTLSMNGKTKKHLIHRLVAETFIDNPDNLPQVNHKDGDPKNNNINNLEWVSNAENTQHAYKNKLRKEKVIWVFDGLETVPLMALCKKLNLNYKKTWYRLKILKWNINDALNFKGGGQYVVCETVRTSE